MNEQTFSPQAPVRPRKRRMATGALAALSLMNMAPNAHAQEGVLGQVLGTLGREVLRSEGGDWGGRAADTWQQHNQEQREMRTIFMEREVAIRQHRDAACADARRAASDLRAADIEAGDDPYEQARNVARFNTELGDIETRLVQDTESEEIVVQINGNSYPVGNRAHIDRQIAGVDEYVNNCAGVQRATRYDHLSTELPPLPQRGGKR